MGTKRARTTSNDQSPVKPSKRPAHSPADLPTPASTKQMSDEAMSDYYDSDDDMGFNDEGGEDVGMDNEEDDEEDYAQFEPATEMRKKSRPWEVQYTSLEPEKLRKLMAKDIEHITNLCSVDTDTATILLRHYKWNQERLIDQFMEGQEGILARAGLPTSSTKAPSRGRVFDCPICATERLPIKEGKALSCGHIACKECWEAYLTAKVKDEGDCDVKCMEGGCGMRVPETWVKQLVDKPTFDRYQELLLINYVSDNRSLRFCPYPSCTFTVETPNFLPTSSALATTVPTVQCGQSHVFCFGCGEAADHRPLICSIVKMWLRKCADDSETANWIKSNTKECPKCVSTIEKNGGCNHMTCKKCKYEFCWVCMGPWSEHGTAWYNCNRFEEAGSVEARDAQSKSRASLERYLHYYNRYANHEQSAKLDRELYAKTEKKMEEMQIASELTWIEVQFARRAVDELVRCRTTLKWTYAMAFYLQKENETEMFEDNQRDLERAVEELSELLESPIEPATISELRAKMTNLTVYVQKRNEIVLDDTAQKYIEGAWHWIVDVPEF